MTITAGVNVSQTIMKFTLLLKCFWPSRTFLSPFEFFLAPSLRGTGLVKPLWSDQWLHRNAVIIGRKGVGRRIDSADGSGTGVSGPVETASDLNACL
jgi:hypothetical protein